MFLFVLLSSSEDKSPFPCDSTYKAFRRLPEPHYSSPYKESGTYEGAFENPNGYLSAFSDTWIPLKIQLLTASLSLGKFTIYIFLAEYTVERHWFKIIFFFFSFWDHWFIPQHFHFQSKVNWYYMGGETLAQIAQRGGRCPTPGNIQGQAGQRSEQPDLVEDVPAYGRELGTIWSLRSLPTQTILEFHDGMIFTYIIYMLNICWNILQSKRYEIVDYIIRHHSHWLFEYWGEISSSLQLQKRSKIFWFSHMLFNLKSALHLWPIFHSHPQILIQNSFFQSCLQEKEENQRKYRPVNFISVPRKAIEKIHL